VLPPAFVALLMLTKEHPVIHMDRTMPKLPWLGRFIVNLITSFPATIALGLFVAFLTANLSLRKALMILFVLGVVVLTIALFVSSVRIPKKSRMGTPLARFTCARETSSKRG
jgi:hypothetical protein